MKYIDVSAWKRAMHCQVFRNSVNPQYCVTFHVDITNFLFQVKKRGFSFTFSFVYAVTKCANEIEEFRCRFVEGKPAIFETIHTSFTYLDKSTELFKVINVPMQDKMEDYVALAQETEENQTEYFVSPMANDIYQFSSFPWVSFSHISHTESGKKDNATPLFDWGKFYEKEGKIFMPFSVQVHHSFVDGVHIGKLAGKLQSFLDNFGQVLGNVNRLFDTKGMNRILGKPLKTRDSGTLVVARIPSLFSRQAENMRRTAEDGERGCPWVNPPQKESEPCAQREMNPRVHF